jgi:hypothetical protein
MGRVLVHKWIAMATVVAAAAARPAAADPPDILRSYRFIPSQSAVYVSGGIAPVNFHLNIDGRFLLSTGYSKTHGVSGPYADRFYTYTPYAAFSEVDAILYNPKMLGPAPMPGWDLDETLNLSGLKGTFNDPSVLYFDGVDGQGAPFQLQAELKGKLIYIKGANQPRQPGYADFRRYQIAAIAHMAPYADFNLDGLIDDGDSNILASNFGLTAGAAFEQGDADGDGDVDGDDFLTWRSQVGVATDLKEFGLEAGGGAGATPEPSTIALLFIALLSAAPRLRRQRFQSRQ